MFGSILIPLIPIFITLIVLFIIIRRFKKRGRYSPFTDNFLREPGETLREKLRKVQDSLMESFTFTVFAGTFAAYAAKDLQIAPIIMIFTIFLIFFVYQTRKLNRLISEMVTLRLGLEGERATGQELSMLMRDGAWVFHDLPYQYGNIDHIVISRGGVFAVETKAVSKPTSETSNRAEWKVTYDGKSLSFPHRNDTAALDQARLHAKYLHKNIKKKLGIHAVVTPIVAIPGWYINRTGKSDVWVINPKDRNQLRKELVVETLSAGEAERIAAHIESVARSVLPVSKRLDPDAKDHYDFWNNPRYKPPSVD